MSIAKKLNEARKKLEPIQKSTNKNLNYKFYAAESIASAAKKAFDEVGLILIPTAMELLGDEIISKTGKDGKVIEMRQATIQAEYTLINPEDDSNLVIKSLGRAQDSVEKNVSKAQTQALKQALMTILLIAEDSEQDAMATGEITPKDIEKLIAESKTEANKKKLFNLINDLSDNTEKSRLMKLLNQKKG